MKKQNSFYSSVFKPIYSNGVLYNNIDWSLAYFFQFNKDIFNTEIWLKRKQIVVENTQMLKFKIKFSRK